MISPEFFAACMVGTHVDVTHAPRTENRREILEAACGLGLTTCGHQLARRRVLGDRTAEIDETIDFDRLGKRADRRRELGRGNCDLAHGKLLWIPGWMVRVLG